MNYCVDENQLNMKNTVVALGKFDGIHRGHMILIDELIKYQNTGLMGVVFTFDTPPGNVLWENNQKLIYSINEKKIKLEETGIDALVRYPFTKEFANTTPEEFVKKILINKLGVKVIVVGEDYCFGKNRAGNVELLKKFGNQFGFKVVVKNKLMEDGEIISSTLIRYKIAKGEIESANNLLGSPYSIYGEVVHGRSLGHTIGIPTVNQIIEEDKLIPPFGAYGANVVINGKKYNGIANIGTKPTVNKNNVVGIETNIFDFNENIYGKTIKVELLSFIRPEMKFNNIDSLVAQINEDIIKVNKQFSLKSR